MPVVLYQVIASQKSRRGLPLFQPVNFASSRHLAATLSVSDSRARKKKRSTYSNTYNLRNYPYQFFPSPTNFQTIIVSNFIPIYNCFFGFFEYIHKSKPHTCKLSSHIMGQTVCMRHFVLFNSDELYPWNCLVVLSQNRYAMLNLGMNPLGTNRPWAEDFWIATHKYQTKKFIHVNRDGRF